MTAWKTTPPWQSIDLPPALTKTLHTIVGALDVENALRYRQKPGATYCNIFVSDVTRAAGQEVPHVISTITGEAAELGSRNSREMRANDMVRWLADLKHGWREASRADAFDSARDGWLVVVCWDSQSIKPGHIAILLPEGTIAQAGAKNFVGGTVAQGFGNLPVRYFVSPKQAFKPQQTASDNLLRETNHGDDNDTEDGHGL